MTLLAINLIVNSACSFFAGLAIVWFAIWVFRIPDGRWTAALLTLPYLKIVLDFLRGIPSNSVLVSGVDPFALPPKHQILSIGAGMTNWGPQLSLTFSTQRLDHQVYASSLGDYAAMWMHRQLGDATSAWLVGATLAVSLALVTDRCFQAFRFERMRRSDRLKAKPFSTRRTFLRDVDIYVSDQFSGTPFTGGILKPYICLPADTISKLTDEEVRAVICHEIGHVVSFDLFVTFAIQLLGDALWFVPGYRILSRKIDGLREINADSWATRHGAEPARLASALIKLREAAESSPRFVLYSAFYRRESLLKTRVESLLNTRATGRSRFGWRFCAVRIASAVLIFSAVMLATMGGNHGVQQIQNPEWFEQLLRSLKLSK